MQHLKKLYNGWRLRRAMNARDRHPVKSPEWIKASARVQAEVARILKDSPRREFVVNMKPQAPLDPEQIRQRISDAMERGF